MWIKFLFIVILFYFFALLQNSFFIYFNVLGAIPNFIFIFFFLLIFFSKREDYYETIFYSLVGGLFLGIFSTFTLAVSTMLLLMVGVLTKKIILSLKRGKQKYNFIYFSLFFAVSFLIYQSLLHFYFYFFNQQYISLKLSPQFLAEILYTLLFAMLGFAIYKKIIKNKDDKEVDFFKNVLQ